MTSINQKAYLKKYLSGTKDGKKKKRKKKGPIPDRVKIIDDDIDMSHISTFEEAADLLNTNEDAPQVVGVIDERPMHLRIDDYRKSDLWKPLGANDDAATVISEVSKDSAGDSSPPRRKITVSMSVKKRTEKSKHSKRSSITPPRNRDREKRPNEHSSPPRNNEESSYSPRHKEGDASPPRRNKNRSDVSPPQNIDVSQSPPGKVGCSQPRKSRWNSDSSPRRKPANSCSPPQRSPKVEEDYSPPRRTRKNSNESLAPSIIRRDDDNSPPRRRRRDSDNSPPRKSIKREIITPPRASSSKTVEEPKRKLLPGDKKGKYLIPAKRQDKMTKTLDGRNAGLQDKTELLKENQALRQREDDLFKNMAADVSGANAAPIMRDRRTGKIRDFQKEAEERIEKEKREEENKQKYSRWGRGLKQVEAYEDRLASDLHEMNKPLARYADDEDLEKYLKEQEREGDPMLAYIRKKKKKKIVESGKPLKPEYEGEFMPNRFGIRPGYRWDGVDRSNGYEKKWFEVQNAKQAELEEMHKWSIEDM